MQVGDYVKVKVGRGVFEGRVTMIEGNSASVQIPKLEKAVSRKLDKIEKFDLLDASAEAQANAA